MADDKNVNEQRAARQGYANNAGDSGGGGGQGSGKYYGQFERSGEGSGSVDVTSEGEKFGGTSYADADSFLGAEVVDDIGGSDKAPAKGSSNVQAPDMIKGADAPPDPEVKTYKGRMK